MNNRSEQRQPSSGYQPRSGGSPPERRLTDVWPRYLEGGYFEGEEKNLRLEYVERLKMEEIAQLMASARPALTSNQLRRFFGHSRAVEAQLRAAQNRGDTDGWARLMPLFQKLDVAAADARSKTEAKIPQSFHDFIMLNVRAVHNERDFLEGFLPHFEALVGFGSKYLDRERR